MLALFARTDEIGFWIAPDDLKENDTIRIVSGPFAEAIARVKSVKPENRVILLMDLMGRTVCTDAEAKHLALI